MSQHPYTPYNPIALSTYLSITVDAGPVVGAVAFVAGGRVGALGSILASVREDN